jgi:hypothetical protein
MESDEQQGAGAGKAPAPAAKAELQDLTPKALATLSALRAQTGSEPHLLADSK